MEPSMKKTFSFVAAAAALVMATSTTQAGDGMSFNIDGQTIRIEAPRNCNSLSCISVTKNGSPVDMKNMDRKADDDNVATSSPPAPLAPPAAALQAAPAPAPVANIAS